MGYEVVYRYHEKDESGSYKSEIKELKKKVGTPYEDIPIEKLASIIMSQLARRDIWILPDVEIYEYKKSKINFRETKGGIVIKNKKFELDTDANVIVHDFQDGSLVPAPVPNGTIVHHNTALANNRVNLAGPTGRPIKFVVLDPDNVAKVKQSGLAFVPDKRYPVFSEVAHPKQFGVMIYTMLDENKREVSVTDEYFLNADQKLIQGFNSTVDRSNEPKLSYGDYENEKMPDIRRK